MSLVLSTTMKLFFFLYVCNIWKKVCYSFLLQLGSQENKIAYKGVNVCAVYKPHDMYQ